MTRTTTSSVRCRKIWRLEVTGTVTARIGVAGGALCRRERVVGVRTRVNLMLLLVLLVMISLVISLVARVVCTSAAIWIRTLDRERWAGAGMHRGVLVVTARA